MSISEPFIRRPVATSLLMAGVILLGTLGYQIAADLGSAESGFSDDRGHDVLSGRERRCDGLGNHDATGAPVWADRRARLDEFHELVRGIDNHIAVRAGSADRRGRAGCAGGDQCGQRIFAARPAEPAEIQQGQSSRHTDPHSRDHVGQFAARSRE